MGDSPFGILGVMTFYRWNWGESLRETTNFGDLNGIFRHSHRPQVHPGRLTWNLQITHSERNMIFQTSMIMFHVNLQGCKRSKRPTVGSMGSFKGLRKVPLIWSLLSIHNQTGRRVWEWRFSWGELWQVRRGYTLVNYSKYCGGNTSPWMKMCFQNFSDRLV